MVSLAKLERKARAAAATRDDAGAASAATAGDCRPVQRLAPAGGRCDTPAMRLPLFQVDAFTSRRFGGNPAAVVVEYLRGEIEV